MMFKTTLFVCATDLVRRLADTIDDVRVRGEAVTITKHGKPLAILAPLPKEPAPPTHLLRVEAPETGEECVVLARINLRTGTASAPGRWSDVFGNPIHGEVTGWCHLNDVRWTE